jgi:hypothetical protein
VTSRETALRSLIACLRASPALAGETSPRIEADDWPAVISLADEFLLGPALYAALSASDALVGLPDDVAEYLRHLYRSNRRRNRVVRRQIYEIVEAFNRADIAPLLLKGALTLVALPRVDSGSCMMANIDIAVPRQAETAAIRALQRLGYAVGSRYPADHHAYAEFMRQGNPASVDLHFELIDRHYVLPAGEVWLRSRSVMGSGGTTFRYPWPTHRILHNVLHAQLQYRGAYDRASLDLRQLHEFAVLSKSYGAAIHWEYVRDRLQRHKLIAPFQSYMWAAHALFGTPWPYHEDAETPVKLHYWLCRAQLSHPMLRKFGVPWGNLGAAFAWRRMTAKYDTLGHHRSSKPSSRAV